jgi:AcrR family transcriptional regulator
MAGRKRVRNPASKEMILDAAERVITKRGPAHFTLDAVAAEAGISKGGLLYNFPSKQSLIEGMVLGHIERFRQRFEALRADREGPDSVICSLIEARKASGVARGTGLVILSGIAENPALLSPLRKKTREALAEVRSNATDPVIATMIWLAIDGLEFLELLDISPFDEAGRKELEAEMADYIKAGRGPGCRAHGAQTPGPAGGSS